jgi:hypothetical protein
MIPEQNYALHIPLEILTIISFLGGIGMAVFVAGRHVGRIISKMTSTETLMTHGFAQNHQDHMDIHRKLDAHSIKLDSHAERNTGNTFTFNTTDCAADGSDLQMLYTFTRSGGSAANRNWPCVDTIEWNVTHAAGGAERRVVIID